MRLLTRLIDAPGAGCHFDLHAVCCTWEWGHCRMTARRSGSAEVVLPLRLLPGISALVQCLPLQLLVLALRQ